MERVFKPNDKAKTRDGSKSGYIYTTSVDNGINIACLCYPGEEKPLYEWFDESELEKI